MKRCRERREIGDSEASCSPPTRHADALVHTAVCLGCMRRILSWSHVHIAARCFRENAAAALERARLSFMFPFCVLLRFLSSGPCVCLCVWLAACVWLGRGAHGCTCPMSVAVARASCALALFKDIIHHYLSRVILLFYLEDARDARSPIRST